MKFFAFVRSARIAMGINMDHADRAVGTDSLQNWMTDGMIAADSHGNDALRHNAHDKFFDVSVALRKVKPALERHITNIGNHHFMDRCAIERVIIGSDPFNRPQGAWAEP